MGTLRIVTSNTECFGVLIADMTYMNFQEYYSFPLEIEYYDYHSLIIEIYPQEGYTFSYWTEQGGDSNPLYLETSGDITLTPVFTSESPPATQVTIQISSNQSGTCDHIVITNNTSLEVLSISSFPYSYICTKDDSVTLQAYPEDNYVFQHWYNGIDTNYDTDNPTTSTWSSSGSKIAVFTSTIPVPTSPNVSSITDYTQTYSLPFYIIDWHETQESLPAIRDVPTGSSQYLDSGTYLIKTRKIDAVFRVTDAERDTLNTIFDENKLVYIYLLPDFGIDGWIYLCWIKSKNIAYEYKKWQADRIWRVSLQLEVKSFKYYSDIANLVEG